MIAISASEPVIARIRLITLVRTVCHVPLGRFCTNVTLLPVEGLTSGISAEVWARASVVVIHM